MLFMQDLRQGMESYVNLQQPKPMATEDEVNVRAILVPCVAALIAVHVNRGGNGTNVVMYREGPRRQPQGFRLEHSCLLLSTHDARVAWGPERQEGDRVQIVVQRAAAVAVQ